MRGFVLEFGDNVFFADHRVLFCEVCKRNVKFKRRSSVLHYIQTEKHAKMVKPRQIILNKNTQ